MIQLGKVPVCSTNTNLVESENEEKHVQCIETKTRLRTSLLALLTIFYCHPEVYLHTYKHCSQLPFSRASPSRFGLRMRSYFGLGHSPKVRYAAGLVESSILFYCDL
jgi:hypothetical protein